MTTTPAHPRPSGAGEPHPAVAEPPPSPADHGGSLDRVVFGVSAVVALAFVGWGFATPAGLGSASATALEWVETNLGWLFVLLASAFVVFVLWLAAGSTGGSRWAATTRRRSSAPSPGSR